MAGTTSRSRARVAAHVREPDALGAIARAPPRPRARADREAPSRRSCTAHRRAIGVEITARIVSAAAGRSGRPARRREIRGPWPCGRSSGARRRCPPRRWAPPRRAVASAAWRSWSMKPRNEMPPSASYCRASSATCRTLASACSPPGRSMKPDMRAGRVEQLGNRVGHGTVVTTPMELLQQSKSARRSAADGRSARRRAQLRAGIAAQLARDAEWDGTVRSDGGIRAAASSSIAKSEPFSVANTDSSSSGHSIAASAARIVSTSSRSWNALPPTSRCGMPRASSAAMYGRVVSSDSS